MSELLKAHVHGSYGRAFIVYPEVRQPTGYVEFTFRKTCNDYPGKLAKLEGRFFFCIDGDIHKLTDEEREELRNDIKLLVCLALSGRDPPHPKSGYHVGDATIYEYESKEQL